MAFRLLVNCPTPQDGTSMYRGWGPLSRLRETQDIDLVHIESFSKGGRTDIDWTHVMSVDAIFLQRAFIPYQVNLAHLAKIYKKPIWVDYDDNLFCVPTDNPTHDIYGSQQSQNNINQIAGMADVITVSTEALYKIMSKLNKNVRIVPNALDMKTLHRVDEDVKRNPFVMWRGSHTHVNDLMLYTKQIIDAYIRNPQWSFVFVGYNPFWITSKMDKKRWRYVPFNNEYAYYMMDLQKFRGAIHIVPLANNEFNRCKSRISQLESSLAGSVCLAPNWKEWEGGNFIRYDNEIDFGEKLQNLMNLSMDRIAEINKVDFEWVMENRSLQIINEARGQIVDSLKVV